MQAALAVVFLIFIFAPSTAQALQGHLNINRATAEELQKLPFIGEARAQAIISYRRQHGPFSSLEQLLQSATIGPSTFEAIKPYLTLSGLSTLTETPTASPGPQTDTAGAKTAVLKKYNFITLGPGAIRLLPDAAYYDALRPFLHQARKSIDICMFLFKITDSRQNLPAKIIRELIRAEKRGVRITVLLENSGYDEKLNKENHRVARILKKNRITVRFDTPKTTTHAKLVVIDQRFSFIGSHNLTESALAFNHEFSLLIDSPPLAGELIRYMQTINSK